VRCRIDRSGRLLEAGIEEESVVAAFDRAALRAIFAAAPFPPLPQGFSGQSLTLHLDFGPQ
jgi:TonB family protein